MVEPLGLVRGLRLAPILLWRLIKLRRVLLHLMGRKLVLVVEYLLGLLWRWVLVRGLLIVELLVVLGLGKLLRLRVVCALF